MRPRLFWIYMRSILSHSRRKGMLDMVYVDLTPRDFVFVKNHMPPIKDCSIDTTTDQSYCGGCDNKCTTGGGVLKSSCSNSTYLTKCKPGFTLCFNDCVKGGCEKPPLPGCQTFYDNQCKGNDVQTDPEMAKRRWFTIN
ncbi:hypothetical protein AKO1_005265 [Acrasis kona]|uniref:Uncharacterized protein n=1 Tax=Acrasis kona TaxID=1008807 RepID=A0AAW2YLJ9_9EUKA